MTYLRFLAERVAAIFDRGYMPYERKVCLWAWNLELAFILVPALAMVWWWAAWWDLFLSLFPEELLWPWAGYTVWGAGWLGGFGWADLGPAEWWSAVFLGGPYQPNIFNTTLEKWEGPKEDIPELVLIWLATKHQRVRPWDGDPPGGRFS